MFIMMARRTTNVAFLFAALACAQSSTTSAPSVAPSLGYCYYPDPSGAGRGLTAQDDRPCNPDAETSMCCPTGYTCMTNKVCQLNGDSANGALVGSIRRATCTNPRWNSTVCGDICLDVPGNGDLIACGSNDFVCAGDAEADCPTRQNVFNIPLGERQTVIPIVQVATATSTSSVSSLRPSTLTTSARPSSSGNSTAEPEAEEDEDEKDRTRTIAIGAGVGGAVALFLLLGLLWWFCVRKPKDIPSGGSSPTPLHKPEPELPEPNTTNTSSMTNTGVTPVPPVPPVPYTDFHNGRTGYPFTDEHEVEIATGAAPGTVPPPPTAPIRRPDHLTGGDRENAGIVGRMFMDSEGSRVGSPPPASDLSSAAGGPRGYGSRGDLLADIGPPPTLPPVGGRVSPLYEGRPAGV